MNFRRLVTCSLIAAAIGLLLIAACYFFIDRPVAKFVHNQRLPAHAWLKGLTYPPPIMQAWAPLAIALLIVRRWFSPFRRWELAAIAACVGLILADQFRESLAFVFGRTWPDTWIDNNPSLIRDGVSSFHLLHGGAGYESFPSGHTARIAAFVVPIAMAYPQCRWICFAAVALTGLGLIGMNYHFVGDVIAGGLIGGLVGAFTASFAGIDSQQ